MRLCQALPGHSILLPKDLRAQPKHSLPKTFAGKKLQHKFCHPKKDRHARKETLESKKKAAQDPRQKPKPHKPQTTNIRFFLLKPIHNPSPTHVKKKFALKKFYSPHLPNNSSPTRTGLTVLCAYIIFSSISAPYQTRRRFTKEYSKYFCNCLCCTKRDPRYYFHSTHRISFHPADNPYNIKWENLEQGTCKHSLKQLCVWLLFTVMAIICFILVFTINQATADIVVKNCPENQILISELGNSEFTGEHRGS